ncbi:hypothetical protein BRC81_08645 [Halobacteriales archaeon QS_1_68_20]|nr:MAG: hypothetical protein BRC81_08645 [Halobacteriales archaeon QS_1_68_20]
MRTETTEADPELGYTWGEAEDMYYLLNDDGEVRTVSEDVVRPNDVRFWPRVLSFSVMFLALIVVAARESRGLVQTLPEVTLLQVATVAGLMVVCDRSHLREGKLSRLALYVVLSYSVVVLLFAATVVSLLSYGLGGAIAAGTWGLGLAYTWRQYLREAVRRVGARVRPNR